MTMTMKKVFATGLSAAVLSIGSLALNPVTAQAATISQSLSVSMAPTDWQQNLSFSKFDSSLGTLNSISILMGSTVVGGGSLKNNGSGAATGIATLSSEVELFDSSLVSLGIVNPIFTDRLRTIDSTSLAAGSTKTYTDVTVTSSRTYSFVDAPTLAYFTGVGVGSLTATGTGISGWNGSSNIGVDFTTSASASYTITYNYSVAAAVPEPLTILGAATAVGFGATFKRRALKNNKKG